MFLAGDGGKGKTQTMSKLIRYHCEQKWKIEDYDDSSSWMVIVAESPKQAAEVFAEKLWYERPNKKETRKCGHWAIGVKQENQPTWAFFDVNIKIQTVFKAIENRDYRLVKEGKRETTNQR